MRLRAGALAAAALVALSACDAPGDNPPVKNDTPTDAPPAAEPLAPIETAQSPIVEEPEFDAITQCAGAETVLFSCTLEDGLLVSVCVPGEPSMEGQAQFRMGSLGEPADLRWPISDADGELVWANTMYSGGGESQISFKHDAAQYVLFSRMVRTNFEADEPNYSEFSAGLVKLDGEEIISISFCDANQFLSGIPPFLADKHLDSADDLFTRAHP